MKDMHQVLKRPLLTEKTSEQKDYLNQVVFEVDIAANKIDIRRAVERLLAVKVLDVNTSIIRGKVKRLGRHMGRRPNWKKAVVTLAPGERVEFLEGT